MNQLFDAFNLPEIPIFVLCQPDRTQLYAMGEIYDTNLKLKYNALSEFYFTAPSKVNGQDVPYFSLLEYPRQIYIQGVGYFVITGVEDKNDGIQDIKEVSCVSGEYVFVSKKLSVFNGTFKFFDPITPANTLIGTLLSYVPGWTVGTIDSSLWNKYRTFNEADTTIYNFLMTKVETAYQCIFTFDTINQTISAKTPTVESASTDIFLSHDNLLESSNLKPVTEELVTSLNVYGGGDLSINTVNPLGTNAIYNFNYFMNTAWMSASLISALTNWNAKISGSQVQYANLLTDLKDENTLLLVQSGSLVQMQETFDDLDGVRGARIQQGLDYSDINAQIAIVQAQMTAQQALINTTGSTINSITGSLVTINTGLSFNTNFTPTEQSQLSNFIFGSTYQNENFIQTDIMTNVEIQDMAQELYNQAQAVLTKLSVPRYEFSVDAVNFVFLKDFQTFTNQLQMGSTITVKVNDSSYVYPALLELDLTYDDPTQFSMTFSNRLRLDNCDYIYTDLMGKSVQSSITTTFNSEQWSSWQNNYKDDVSTFITSALDASLNNVISSTNQEIIMNQNGLKGRKLDPNTGTYDPKQFWMNNNILCFTQDNWQTASLALGLITTPTGGSAWGLVADSIVGRLLAGNELIITNEGNNFILDANGAILNNASITLTRNNNTCRIQMDANVGIQIQKNSSGSWVNQFYVDSAGNVVFTGNLIGGANGTFTGTIYASAGQIGAWTIDNLGLKDNNGNYIYGNGNMKVGALRIAGDTATFQGTIYADKIYGAIVGGQIATSTITPENIDYLSADDITVGSLSADRIHGGTITWDGGKLGLTATGFPTITGTVGVSLVAFSGINAMTMEVRSDRATIGGTGTTSFLGDINFGLGGISIKGQQGVSGNWNIGNNNVLTFVNGILTNNTVASGSSGGITYPGIQTGGNMAGIDLQNYNFSGQDLSGINFADSILDGSNFSNATLYGANFAGASLYNCNLAGTGISGGNFAFSYTDNCTFDGADLIGTNFSWGSLSNCQFTQVTIDGSIFCRADFSNTVISIGSGGHQQAYGCNFARATFVGGTTMTGKFFSCNFGHVDFGVSNLTQAEFDGSDMKFCTMNQTIASGTLFIGVDLTGSLLTNSNFDGADFTGSNLTDTDFSGSSHVGAIDTDAITTGRTGW